MKIEKYIIVLLLLVACITANLNAQSGTNQSFKQHIVKAGETAYSLAATYKVSEQDIYKYNPGSKDGIKTGQTLQIPSPANEIRHVISRKETLYSVSKKYNITEAKLKNENPGLSESNFKIGKEIIIPTSSPSSTTRSNILPSKIEHKVGRKETLYSIAKKYDCLVEDIRAANPSIKKDNVRTGTTIIIPLDGYVYTNTAPDNTPQGRFLPKDGVTRIGVLLPFIQGSKSVNQAKLAEYYEGFLLAVQKMKMRGLNAEIFTFDIGSDNDTKRLESILETYEVKNLDLVIGGISDNQVELISRFAEQNDTKYVVPFTNKSTGVGQDKNMFKVANSHAKLYYKVVDKFIDQFNSYNIIFVSENGSDKNKMDFVKVLQEGLQNAQVSYKIAPTTASVIDDLKGTLESNKKNIIIPTSSSEKSLKSIIAGLEALEVDKKNVSFFGYPDWQIYLNKRSKLHSFNSYLYSMFFLDTNQPDVKLFADNYSKWYNKSLIVSYPRFAYMGYDTGVVFLTALQKYGSDFEPKIEKLNVSTLQTAMHFEPAAEEGGYVNRGIYIVNLKPDDTVLKTEITEK